MAEHGATSLLELQYGRRSRPLRRIAFRLFVMLVSGALAFLGWRWVHEDVKQFYAKVTLDWRLRGAYRSCLNFRQSDEDSVFDEGVDAGPAGVSAPLQGGTYLWFSSRGCIAGWLYPPPGNWSARLLQMQPAEAVLISLNVYDQVFGRIRCLPCLRQTPPPYIPRAIAPLFLHGRSAKNGAPRLVAVNFNATAFVTGSATPLSVRVIPPSKWLKPYTPAYAAESALPFACAPSEHLQLYFGQPDSVDKSRFTIRYRAETRSGAIIGQLQDDDSVAFSSREETVPLIAQPAVKINARNDSIPGFDDPGPGLLSVRSLMQ